MKTHHLAREATILAAAAVATASIFAVAPLAHAQQSAPPTPLPASSPAATPADQPDIFDVLKKGADKLQKEARKTREIEPQLRQMVEKQDELLRDAKEAKKEVEARDKEVIQQLEESKRELIVVLTKQQDVLVKLAAAVEKMETQLKAHPLPPMPPAFQPPAPPASLKPSAPPADPSAPLPVTEPPVKP